MTRIIICDRCGRLITKTTYYHITFKDGSKWDTCGDCKCSIQYCNNVLNDILCIDARKE